MTKVVFCLAMLFPAMAQEVAIATTVSFTEGPTVDRDGNVYFSDIMTQRIMKLSAGGVLSTYREHSNVANGLLIDPQGRLIACEGAEFERHGFKAKGKPRITRTDLKTGKIEILAENYQGVPFQGPNDVTIDSKERLAVLHGSGRRGGVSTRCAWQAGTHSCGAGNSAPQRDSDLAG